MWFHQMQQNDLQCARIIWGNNHTHLGQKSHLSLPIPGPNVPYLQQTTVQYPNPRHPSTRRDPQIQLYRYHYRVRTYLVPYLQRTTVPIQYPVPTRTPRHPSCRRAPRSGLSPTASRQERPSGIDRAPVFTDTTLPAWYRYEYRFLQSTIPAFKDTTLPIPGPNVHYHICSELHRVQQSMSTVLPIAFDTYGSQLIILAISCSQTQIILFLLIDTGTELTI